MPAFVDTLIARKWTDAEITEDLEFLKGVLGNSVQGLTYVFFVGAFADIFFRTWEEYVGEVKSGRLSWTPTHQSDAFWKLSISKFNDNNHELIKSLCRLLATSTDPTTLAVAAHDVGQYVKFYPNGKKIVESLGAKTKIMELMASEVPEVRYNALVATQKMMVNAWA